jgi:hypothetical protein
MPIAQVERVANHHEFARLVAEVKNLPGVEASDHLEGQQPWLLA